MTSKYNNKRVQVDGYTFDSKREAARYQELKLLEKAKEIENIAVHPRYALHAYNELTGLHTKICTYEADFAYRPCGDYSAYPTVEDVKGVRTDMYKLKKKWLFAEYGIDIVEIE